MHIFKQKGILRIYEDTLGGLYMAENIKTGKISNWDNRPNFKLSDCKY